MVTSEDGLDAAYWTPTVLALIESNEDGSGRSRAWSGGVLVEDVTEPPAAITGPDAEGDWSLSTHRSITAPDGKAYDLAIERALEGGVLKVRELAKPAGSEGEPQLVGEHTYTKAAP